jgi:flagellar basal-body rod protein FlgC
MSLLSIFEVSGSALSAQNTRLNTTASNLANAQSVAANPEDTYRARHPVFASRLQSEMDSQSASVGVQVLGIVESEKPLELRYEPHHPMANEEGYVSYPNVNAVEEMANMISASRAFQMNVEIMDSTRTLAERLLTMGQ